MSSRNASRYPARKKPPTIEGAKVWKNRREFRAYLIFTLTTHGESLSPDPTYAQLREALDRLVARLP